MMNFVAHFQEKKEKGFPTDAHKGAPIAFDGLLDPWGQYARPNMLKQTPVTTLTWTGVLPP